MRLGLYGGSFDPIHYGHLRPVQAARATLALDRILYLPTARPPHKDDTTAPPEARYAMVELALLDREGLFASPFEMRRERVAYTVDTLEHFRRALPDAELFLILGSDSFAALPAWRRWRRVLEVAELAVLDRPGRDRPGRDRPGHASTSSDLAPELRGAIADGRAHLVPNEPVAVSSTEVRRAIAARSPEVRHLLPPLVLDYIRKYDLYRGTSEITPPI